MKTEDWARVLNRVLDEDIRVLSSSEVSPDFHSRFCAHARHYQYRIVNADVTPFNLRYAHYWWGLIDVEEMSRAAKLLVGEHDFRAFTQDLDPSIENTVRTLYSVKVKRVRNEVWIDISGTAFLRGMMRRISGCLLEIGRGRRPSSDLNVLLSDRRDSIHWPEVLPAKGLTLMRITYGRHPKDHRTESDEN
jgi:tRNA pseudouridine38-40 synthase